MNEHRTNDQLVSFLYILLRDYLPAGDVEEIMVKHIEGRPTSATLTNGYVAQHAEDIASRLRLASGVEALRAAREALRAEERMARGFTTLGELEMARKRTDVLRQKALGLLNGVLG